MQMPPRQVQVHKDLKEIALIAELHRRISSGAFDELDIQNFLIMLRPSRDDQSIPFELGSFVAHRTRERGRFHDRIRQQRDKVIARGMSDASDYQGVVFTTQQIADAYDERLKLFGLEPLPRLRHLQLQIGMFSVLRHSPMSVKTSARPIGWLELLLGPDSIYLNGFSPFDPPVRTAGAGFPILSAPNIVYPICFEYGYINLKPEELLTISYRDGEPVVNGIPPYRLHFGRRPGNFVTNVAPVEWPALQAAIHDLPISAMREDKKEFDVQALDGTQVTFWLHDGYVSFACKPIYLAPGSAVRIVARYAAERLGVPIFDNQSTHLTLDGNGPIEYGDREARERLRAARLPRTQ